MTKLLTFLPETFASSFLNKGLDRAIFAGSSLKDELQDVIQDTIVEFSQSDPRTCGNKLPFYHSASILEELLKFRLMAPEDYDTNKLLIAINNELEIMMETQTL